MNGRDFSTWYTGMKIITPILVVGGRKNSKIRCNNYIGRQTPGTIKLRKTMLIAFKAKQFIYIVIYFHFIFQHMQMLKKGSIFQGLQDGIHMIAH